MKISCLFHRSVAALMSATTFSSQTQFGLSTTTGPVGGRISQRAVRHIRIAPGVQQQELLEAHDQPLLKPAVHGCSMEKSADNEGEISSFRKMSATGSALVPSAYNEGLKLRSFPFTPVAEVDARTMSLFVRSFT